MTPHPNQLDLLTGPEADCDDTDGKLVDHPPGVVARRLASLDWAFKEVRGHGHTHALHPYPAKFVPNLPRQVIGLLSRPGELVLDPFSGGGTTGVEALIAGRDYLGIDANPVGNAIGRAKTTSLDSSDLQSLTKLEASLLALQAADLEANPSWLPSIPNTHKWYDPGVFQALGVVRDLVIGIDPSGARELALLAFIQASARLSFQESETRYSSKPRLIGVLEVPRAVVAELRRMRRIADELSIASASAAAFVDADARDPSAFQIDDRRAGLIVTSPPYPNTYDYHLYHRFRLFWLGVEPTQLRSVEIGSHLKNQGVPEPAQAYLDDMRVVFANSLSALIPGRYMIVVVGDGLFKGEVFGTAGHLAAVAQNVGFDHVVTLDRALPVHRRSVTKPGRRLTAEQILVLRRPAGARNAVAHGPNYKLFPYERELQRRELVALGASPVLADGADLGVVPNPALDRAAFVHCIELEGQRTPTFQCRIEGTPSRSSRRKNSTYFAHGIHRYKGKFYPQLAKSLLNLSGVAPGEALVLDPFGGSGTVALEAILNGYDAVSIDCNPVATGVARAKVALATANGAMLRRRLVDVRAALQDAPRRGSSAITQFAPETRDELDRWFPARVLAKLDWLLGLIRRDATRDAAQLLEVLVSDLIREVSQQEPKDLRIRRRAEPISDAPVYDLFLERLTALESRLAVFGETENSRTRPGVGVVVQGDSSDARTFDVLHGRPIDAVISSPPYAAALPYVDTDRLSLAAVFGFSSRARRPLENTMIGSREISTRERRAFELELAGGCPTLPPSTVAFLSDYRGAITNDAGAGFRLQQTPAVLLRYFLAMSEVLANLADRMKRGAMCWLVVGDSRSTVAGTRWTIPTVDEVAAIAQHRGLQLYDRLPITVTREDVLHARNAITRNEILGFSVDSRAPAPDAVS